MRLMEYWFNECWDQRLIMPINKGIKKYVNKFKIWFE